MSTSTEIQSAQSLINRMASDNYRLVELTRDRHGDDVFSPEVAQAIQDLGHSIEILSDLLEVEEYRASTERLYSHELEADYDN